MGHSEGAGAAQERLEEARSQDARRAADSPWGRGPAGRGGVSPRGAGRGAGPVLGSGTEVERDGRGLTRRGMGPVTAREAGSVVGRTCPGGVTESWGAGRRGAGARLGMGWGRNWEERSLLWRSVTKSWRAGRGREGQGLACRQWSLAGGGRGFGAAPPHPADYHRCVESLNRRGKSAQSCEDYFRVFRSL